MYYCKIQLTSNSLAFFTRNQLRDKPNVRVSASLGRDAIVMQIRHGN